MIKICGTGSCLPKLRVTNDDLSRIMDTSDEWIRSRTGIGSRHLAVEETTTGMSVAAARAALDEAGIVPGDLDLIIAATLSPDNLLPTLACEVQAELGAAKAVAFDIHAACSGFLFSLNTAAAYLQNGVYENALIIGAETLSKMMNWEDRGTCVLFGDGAGAAVVRRLPDDESDSGIKSFVQHSDGSRGGVLSCVGRAVNHPYAKNEISQNYVSMDGQAVYRFAVKTVPQVVTEAVEAAGLNMDQINMFVLHQANQRIIEAAAKRLGQPIGKFPMNLQECGNISAASVPILLDSLNKNGKIKKNDMIVLAGFGAGLTWGAAVIRW